MHIKTIQYKDYTVYSVCIVYDEQNDVYYTSTDIYNSSKTELYFFCYKENKWIHDWYLTSHNLSSYIYLAKYISDNIITEYYEHYPNINKIITHHNKVYKRMQKINQLL